MIEVPPLSPQKQALLCLWGSSKSLTSMSPRSLEETDNVTDITKILCLTVELGSRMTVTPNTHPEPHRGWVTFVGSDALVIGM